MALLASYRELRLLLRQWRADLILSYTIKPVIVGALAGRAERVPRIVSLISGLGYAFTEGPGIKRRLVRRIASFLYRRALARSDMVLFQNRDDQALFQELGLVREQQPQAIVDGSGVDIDFFAAAPAVAEPAFLMIARLLGDKGIREFADAARRLRAEHPNVPIALAGYLDASPDSLTQAELDELIASGIRFHGRLDDVRPVIADCSVYVLPSYREGTPRSVLEAMAIGRAIITTDAPGCRETVVPGVNGFLVPPRDSNALYGAMKRFIENPEMAVAMGLESRRIVEQRYDARRVSADIIRYAQL
jgi:glycosyltransferase involved in cell wall biosynthesis